MIERLFKYFQSNKKWAVLIASIWTALILFACFIPGSNVPKVNLPLIDKWVHFIIFASFSFLWYVVVKRKSTKNSILLFLTATLFGYLVEVIQGSGLVANRSYELNDVIADAIGGLLGVVLYLLLSPTTPSLPKH